MIGKALFSILSTNSAVTTLVATRIYPAEVPQKAALPCLYYVTENIEPLPCRNPRGSFQGSFEVGVLSTSADQITAVLNAVRTALDNYRGTAGGFILTILSGGTETADGFDDTLKAHYKTLMFNAIGDKITA